MRERSATVPLRNCQDESEASQVGGSILSTHTTSNAASLERQGTAEIEFRVYAYKGEA